MGTIETMPYLGNTGTIPARLFGNIEIGAFIGDMNTPIKGVILHP